MKPQNTLPPFVVRSLIAISVVLVGSGTYGFLTLRDLTHRVDDLTIDLNNTKSHLASTTSALAFAINEAQSNLSNAISSQAHDVGQIQQQLGGVQSQVGGLSGTLTNLQKLAATDPELLKKYSKVYFLNENYVPAHLSEIPKQYAYSDKKTLLIHTEVLPHLQQLINDASSTGVKIYALSAYRSFAEQRALKGEYTMYYGAGTANSFAADQGYSEHQLGTAVDFEVPGQGGQLEDTFADSPGYKWLIANAYKYGFILSYPKNNGYYTYEPWHWRFVGTKLALDLHNSGQTFYNMDQRTIDAYLINIFD